MDQQISVIWNLIDIALKKRGAFLLGFVNLLDLHTLWF
jgi:hypothetical protein